MVENNKGKLKKGENTKQEMEIVNIRPLNNKKPKKNEERKKSKNK